LGVRLPDPQARFDKPPIQRADHYDVFARRHNGRGGLMFFNLFSPRKRAASREFEIAIRYLLHDAENVIPFLKEAYKDKWSGFIDNILSGTRPYEEAAAIIGSFMQDSFQGLDRQKRHEIVASIAGNNLASPPK
jgi:hypothetical protein